MIYFYSDPHFGHRNMAEVFQVNGRPARPFGTLEATDDAMEARYRACVTPDDTVWWLGDIAFGKAALDRIAGFPGKRHLILGNHDRDSALAYRSAGFVKIRSSWTTEGMLITHIPIHPSCLSEKVPVNVHGHTHHRTLGWPYVNVCVEQTDYAPIALSEVRRIASGMKERE